MLVGLFQCDGYLLDQNWRDIVFFCSVYVTLHSFKFIHIKLVANVILLVAWSYDSFYIKYHVVLLSGDITAGRGTYDGVLHGPLAFHGIIIQKSAGCHVSLRVYNLSCAFFVSLFELIVCISIWPYCFFGHV